MDYSFYVVDTETTGLDNRLYDVIELSLLRIKDGEQKTWLIQPTNPQNYEPRALKINGHKLEDLQHLTKEGKSLYQPASKVIVEVENWLEEDQVPSEYRCMIGQNISFDRYFLEQLWSKCNAVDTFPFGRRFIDTMVIELFMDYCKGQFADYYNLGSIIKKYGIKNDKAHSAASDTKATKEVFVKQVEYFKNILDFIKNTIVE